MKAYFEYISENDKSYRRSKSIWILIILFLVIIQVVSFYSNNKLEDYSKAHGIVQSIKPSIVHVKPSGSFDLRKSIQKEAIEITINDKSYFVRYQLEKHKNKVFQNIHIMDTIDIYFQQIENHLELYEIKKNGKPYLDYEGRNLDGFYFKLFLLFLLPIFIFIFIYTYLLRKKYLQSKLMR